MLGAWVPSLAGELRSLQHGQKKKSVFSAIPEWEDATCFGAFYPQSLFHWILSESTLDKRETILFHVKYKPYTLPKHSPLSCHHCPDTNKQPSQSAPAKGPRWLSGGCQLLLTEPETKGKKTISHDWWQTIKSEGNARWK